MTVCVGCGERKRIRWGPFCTMRCAALCAEGIYQAGGPGGDFFDPEDEPGGEQDDHSPGGDRDQDHQ